MTAPEVLLDGRVMRPDGSWSGVKVAGEVVRCRVTGDGQWVCACGSPWAAEDAACAVCGTKKSIRPVEYRTRADVFYFETFMERVEREREKAS